MSTAAGVVYEHLPLHLINNLQTQVDSIYLASPEKEKIIKDLYEQKIINHFLEDEERKNFPKYYDLYAKYWHLVDLNQDGKPELLFQGKYEFTDDRAYTEIYTKEVENYQLNYVEIGALIGFKINPFSNEIVLFTHEYPCCESYTHNLTQLRFIGGEIKAKKKFFIARDKGDMKGKFFPDSLSFKSTYEFTTTVTTIYWSDSPILTDAFTGGFRRLENNIICRFPKNTSYKPLAETETALYVLITGNPKVETGLPINPSNLEMLPIYGWIQKNTP